MDVAWTAGSLLAWSVLPLSVLLDASTFKACFLLFLNMTQGVLLHVGLFKYTTPGNVSQALRDGVLLAFLTLGSYGLLLFAIGWTAQWLGARVFAAFCALQLMLIIEGLPQFLFQALACGSIAGFARWKSSSKRATVMSVYRET